MSDIRQMSVPMQRKPSQFLRHLRSLAPDIPDIPPHSLDQPFTRQLEELLMWGGITHRYLPPPPTVCLFVFPHSPFLNDAFSAALGLQLRMEK
jgi:hypothetical protein